MARIFSDRVYETSTTTGLGTFDLDGAANGGYQSFAAAIGSGNTCYYCIVNASANEWEVGLGTVTDAITDTLSRDTVLDSSDNGNKINFSAGTKQVFQVSPASYIDDSAQKGEDATITGQWTFGDKVWISTGDSGLVTPDASADDLVVECNSNAGITIATPAFSTGSVRFAESSTDSNAGMLYFDHFNSRMHLGTNQASNILTLGAGDGNYNVKIDATGKIILSNDPASVDALGAESGTVTISTGNSGVTTPEIACDDLIVEGSAATGIAIFTPNTTSGNIRFGDPENAGAGKINYNHSNQFMQFSVEDNSVVRFDSTGRVITGDTSSDALGADAGSVTISTGDSGVSSISVGADDLIVESGLGGAGITIATPNTETGRLRFADPENNLASDIIFDHENDKLHFRINANTAIGIDSANRVIVSPNSLYEALGASAGSLTVATGDSGVTTPAANADDLVIESSGATGITICTPNNNVGGIRFADPEDPSVGRINYNHALERMGFFVNAAQNFTLKGDGVAVFGDESNDVANGVAGSVVISTGDSGLTTGVLGTADDFIVESGGSVGMTLACPSSGRGRIAFADEAHNSPGVIQYSHGTNAFFFDTDGARALTITSANALYTGIPTKFTGLPGSLYLFGGDNVVPSLPDGGKNLVIEDDIDSGISILTPNLNKGSIIFGDPEDADVGSLVYDHTDDSLAVTVGATTVLEVMPAGSSHAQADSTRDVLYTDNSIIKGERAFFFSNQFPLWVHRDSIGPTDGLVNCGYFTSENTTPNSTGFTIRMDPEYDRAALHFNETLYLIGDTPSATDYTYAFAAFGGSTQRIIFGDITSDCLGAEKGSVTISTGNSGVTSLSANGDDLVIENDGAAGITIATPNNTIGTIKFADPEANQAGAINYNHVTNAMVFSTNASTALTIESDGTLVVGTANYETLVTGDDDIPNRKYLHDFSLPGVFTASGADSVAGTAVTISIDTEVLDPSSNYSITSNVITVSTAGYYEISHTVEAQCSLDTGAGRSTFETWIERDTGSGFAAIAQSYAGFYLREYALSVNVGGYASTTFICQLTAGDELRLRAIQKLAVNDGVATIAGKPQISIKRIG